MELTPVLHWNIDIGEKFYLRQVSPQAADKYIKFFPHEQVFPNIPVPRYRRNLCNNFWPIKYGSSLTKIWDIGEKSYLKQVSAQAADKCINFSRHKQVFSNIPKPQYRRNLCNDFLTIKYGSSSTKIWDIGEKSYLRQVFWICQFRQSYTKRLLPMEVGRYNLINGIDASPTPKHCYTWKLQDRI